MAMKRLNINIGPETVTTLEELQKDGQSFTETVRRGVALFRYIRNMEKDGYEVHLVKGKEYRQLTVM